MQRSKHLVNEPCRDTVTSGSPSGVEALQLLIGSEVRFVRESLGEILARNGDIAVVGYAADAGQAVTLSRRLRPDLVLLDAAVRDGVSAVRELRETTIGVRVIAFALQESIEAVLTWVEAGAAGYIPNTAATGDLYSIICEIGAGRQTCSSVVAAGLLQRIAATTPSPVRPETGPQALTPRELEIARLISTGLSNKEIARRLNIGLATAKSHVHNALSKLNVQRRGQVATRIHPDTRLG